MGGGQVKYLLPLRKKRGGGSFSYGEGGGGLGGQKKFWGSLSMEACSFSYTERGGAISFYSFKWVVSDARKFRTSDFPTLYPPPP